ncbi:hypothetical protein [Sphingomonas sp. C3-2]|uniref:hypothetical protein n=1 Tax=Sphingomonas sp. C3-2 TaxID=3062169 RepID=UPI00294B0169|nr:hypothetical protein [Sphingomonas sp. C3-2]WOK35606.1 hypothetical protein QYC26_11355 [Sphingomonas sp. C3-2]
MALTVALLGCGSAKMDSPSHQNEIVNKATPTSPSPAGRKTDGAREKASGVAAPGAGSGHAGNSADDYDWAPRE